MATRNQAPRVDPIGTPSPIIFLPDSLGDLGGIDRALPGELAHRVAAGARQRGVRTEVPDPPAIRDDGDREELEDRATALALLAGEELRVRDRRVAGVPRLVVEAAQSFPIGTSRTATPQARRPSRPVTMVPPAAFRMFAGSITGRSPRSRCARSGAISASRASTCSGDAPSATINQQRNNIGRNDLSPVRHSATDPE
jgi:hypothetical protein